MFGVQRCLDRDRRDLLWGVMYVRPCLLYLIPQTYRLPATLDDQPGMWASFVRLPSVGASARSISLFSFACNQQTFCDPVEYLFMYMPVSVPIHTLEELNAHEPSRTLAAAKPGSPSALSKRKWMYSGSTRVKHHGVVSYPRSSSQRPTAWLHSTRDA